jgi:hypothetical protein
VSTTTPSYTARRGVDGEGIIREKTKTESSKGSPTW